MPETYDLVSLGEVMLRLSPPRHVRLRQAGSLDVRVCGAQFNVAADLASLGKKVAFLSKLPDNELGLLARSLCLRYGVDMSHVSTAQGARMGLVFVDFAAEPRESAHLYDRRNSAASMISPADFDWEKIAGRARLAHTDGVFLGLGENCREAAMRFMAAARSTGCTVCFDVNHREHIKTSEQVYRQVLPFVDVLVTNRSFSERTFGFQGSDEDLLRSYHREFGCNTVCLTSRCMQSAVRGSWSSMALHEGRVLAGSAICFDAVDRFGTGDAYFAGFLYGYLQGDVELGLEFGNTLCALAILLRGMWRSSQPRRSCT